MLYLNEPFFLPTPPKNKKKTNATLLFYINVLIVNDCICLQFWTESFVQWSPLGTYLATVHRQGAAVWGGATDFKRLMRYAHPQVVFGFLVSTFIVFHNVLFLSV